MFITIAPIAGCSAGTPGNKRRISGESARATTLSRPDFSRTRSTPSQSMITPASGSATFMTASLQIVKMPSTTPPSTPRRPNNAPTMSPVSSKNDQT